MTALEISKLATKALEEKKGIDIQVIEVVDKTILTDYFIIATGANVPQIKALADEVDEKLSKQGLEAKSISGYQTAAWIILDYGDVIVNVFSKETREFYNLERLWADGKYIDINNLLQKSI